MSEVAPKRFRGAIVSGYQFCITIGLLLASVVDNGTKDRMDSGSYRIPMGLQWLFAVILGVGLFLLPESPRFYVKNGRKDDAAHALSILRGQPADSVYIADELKELIDNHDYEMRNMRAGWADCFTGGWKKPSSNLRRVILGMALQMMQQWTGVNFSMYISRVPTSFH
jgi:MFS family permease